MLLEKVAHLDPQIRAQNEANPLVLSLDRHKKRPLSLVLD